jgi:hypothetical protein
VLTWPFGNVAFWNQGKKAAKQISYLSKKKAFVHQVVSIAWNLNLAENYFAVLNAVFIPYSAGINQHQCHLFLTYY